MKIHFFYFGVMFIIWTAVLLFLQPDRVKVFDQKTSTFIVSYPLLLSYSILLASLTTIVHLLRLSFLEK